jgi:hypothetical protein
VNPCPRDRFHDFGVEVRVQLEIGNEVGCHVLTNP